MAATSRMISVTSCNASHTNWRKVFGFLGGIRFSPNTVFRFSMSAGCPLRPGRRERGEEKGERKNMGWGWDEQWTGSLHKSNPIQIRSQQQLVSNQTQTGHWRIHFNERQRLLFPRENNLSNQKVSEQLHQCCVHRPAMMTHILQMV